MGGAGDICCGLGHSDPPALPEATRRIALRAFCGEVGFLLGNIL